MFHFTHENIIRHCKAQFLLSATQSLTLKHSTFCPHSVFLCVVWIWEQTAIISLYSINWQVFYNRDGVFTGRYGLSLCVYSRYNPFKAQWLFYVPPVTFTNPTFGSHSVFVRLCGSQNKQRLFPYTALSDWFYNRDGLRLLRGTNWIYVWHKLTLYSLVFFT
jgi:hypothetical protein